ncbi:MAG TPA: hypothetical protein VIE68_02470 [Gemmatimonadota bacterium]|jgi:hypothetical protein
MKSLCARLILTVGLIVTGSAACQSDLPTSAEPDPSLSSSPAPLLAPLLKGSGKGPVTLVRVRSGQTLTPDDAKLTVFEGSLSFPAVITKTVDGRRYMSFKFGPNGLKFLPAAVLAISVNKADLSGIDPRRLKIAVASDDREDWRVVGGFYEPITRTVIAPVLHFSRYALCVD